MRHTDGELVYKCLQGDNDAFAILVRRYQDAVYATAYHYAGRYGGAEDISQEVFWAAYRSLPQIKSPDRFGSWIKGITTRVAANWLRRNAPRLRNETPLPHRRAVSLEEARQHLQEVSDSDDYDAIHVAIEALPERYQVPVVLRYVQELSYEEISRFTGDSYDEIRGILNRASKLLRDMMLQRREQKEQGVIKWPRAAK